MNHRRMLKRRRRSKKQMMRQFYAAVEEVFDMTEEDWEAYEKEIENPYDL